MEKKTATFSINKSFDIPVELEKYNPEIKENNLIVNYDKKETNLSEIIGILNKYKIIFFEINTNESSLEDVFINVINQK